ncbi:MAG: fumarate hydratase C-terminal domain-containing protein [Armatimonadetes bacterium]|nr:fumarate hydratase C-terminal domain-containing protein [Armatimonadota bacterium]
MADVINLHPPLTEEDMLSLKAGDRVLITGTLITGRDAAHRRLMDLIEKGEPLPIDVAGQMIYYVGPSPAPPGAPIGSAGPTTAYRMDKYVEPLLKLGLRATIGKGFRGATVKEALKTYKAVHLHAIGGLGALLSKRIKSARIIAYEDLGPEAIYEFDVEDFPVIVANDAHGGDVYSTNVRQFSELPEFEPSWVGGQLAG